MPPDLTLRPTGGLGPPVYARPVPIRKPGALPPAFVFLQKNEGDTPGGNFFIYTKFEIVIFQSATPKSRTAPRQDFFAHFFYAFQHADNIQTPAKQEKNTPSTSDILKIERDMKNSLKFKKPTQAKTQFPFSEA